MRDARDAFMQSRGYRLAEYDARVVKFPVPGFPRWSYPFPNPPARRWAVRRHDLHHVVTGYDTDYRGEIEVSAWECGAGLGRNYVAWLIPPSLFLLGLVVRPRSTWRAFQRGRACRRSLLGHDVTYAQLLDMTVAEARVYVGLQDER